MEGIKQKKFSYLGEGQPLFFLPNLFLQTQTLGGLEWQEQR